MTKPRTKLAALAVWALALVAALAVLPYAAAPAVAEGETYNVAALFSAAPGASAGTEKSAAAYAANDLPAYLYDSANAGFKTDYSGKGALVTVQKTTATARYAVRSAPFRIDDNTAETTLLSLIPAGAYNQYYDKGLADIPATDAYGDTANWPPIRDITVRVIDGADPDNYFTVDFSWSTGENASYYLSRAYAYAPGQVKAAERGDGTLRPSPGGALVPQSYWGNTYAPFALYYDSADNALYADTCDVSGGNISRTLIRDFDRAYDNDAVTWDGFTGEYVYIELAFAGGNGTSKVLVTDLDGLNLACDETGALDGEAAAAYNATDSGYFAAPPSAVFEDGLIGYAVPAMARRNMLGEVADAAFAGGFTVKVTDGSGADITASAVSGLSEGRWTEEAVFTPPAAGGYTFTYTSADGKQYVMETSVSDYRSVDALFSASDGSAVTFEYDRTAPAYMSGDVLTRAGLGVRFTDDVTLTFNNPVDTRLLTADTPLLSYLVTPAVKAEYSGETTPEESSEFTTITVRLTDAEDADTYVEIMHVRGNYGTHLSFVTAAADGQAYANHKQN